MAARITACAVALRSVEFGGAVPAEVPVEAFHAAAPTPKRPRFATRPPPQRTPATLGPPET
jgi:hypothetical protein